MSEKPTDNSPAPPSKKDGDEEEIWAEAVESETSDETQVSTPAQSGADAFEDLSGNGSGPTANAPTMQDTNSEDSPNLEVVLDIPVMMTMEVGRTEISIRNLLQLNQGSVVELDRLAGEPLDVMINGTVIAHGEVVVVNDKYGIRMTDVVSPADRIRRAK